MHRPCPCGPNRTRGTPAPAPPARSGDARTAPCTALARLVPVMSPPDSPKPRTLNELLGRAEPPPTPPTEAPPAGPPAPVAPAANRPAGRAPGRGQTRGRPRPVPAADL